MGSGSGWRFLQLVSSWVPWYLLVVTFLLRQKSILQYFLSHVIVSLRSRDCVARTGRDVRDVSNVSREIKPYLLVFTFVCRRSVPVHFCHRYWEFLLCGHLVGTPRVHWHSSFSHSHCYTYRTARTDWKTAFCFFLMFCWPCISV